MSTPPQFKEISFPSEDHPGCIVEYPPGSPPERSGISVLQLENFNSDSSKDLSTFCYLKYRGTPIDVQIELKNQLKRNTEWCLFTKLSAHPIHGMLPDAPMEILKKKIETAVVETLDETTLNTNALECEIYVQCLYNNTETTFTITKEKTEKLSISDVVIQQSTDFEDVTVIRLDQSLAPVNLEEDVTGQIKEVLLSKEYPGSEQNKSMCMDIVTKRINPLKTKDLILVHYTKKYIAPYIAKEVALKELAKLKKVLDPSLLCETLRWV